MEKHRECLGMVPSRPYSSKPVYLLEEKQNKRQVSGSPISYLHHPTSLLAMLVRIPAQLYRYPQHEVVDYEI